MTHYANFICSSSGICATPRSRDMISSAIIEKRHPNKPSMLNDFYVGACALPLLAAFSYQAFKHKAWTTAAAGSILLAALAKGLADELIKNYNFNTILGCAAIFALSSACSYFLSRQINHDAPRPLVQMIILIPHNLAANIFNQVLDQVGQQFQPVNHAAAAA